MEEKRYLLPPPPRLEYFSFGYQASISSMLWVRAIQDFDYCEVQLAKNLCKGNSWLFQILDTAVRLSPDFKEVYLSGALSLSVLVSDVTGAAQLFLKGTRMFPENFQLAYRAGYHALIEEKNEAQAATYFLQAAKIQGKEGTWLYSLATSLMSKTGQKDAAIQIYRDMKEQGLDSGILARMREKLGIKDE